MELADVVADAAATHLVPGVAAGVLTDDGTTIFASHGITNVEHPLAVDEHTLFQVASITKTFTSAAVLLLCESGDVGLDDPVSRHLPSLAADTGLDTDAITVEHLLSHQAGFDGDHLFVSRVADSLVALQEARRLFEPGTGFSYNNAAFSIAGELIAAVSGQSFPAFVRERLLDPLGMATASFSADEAITHRVAAPHVVLAGEAAVLRGAGWQPRWELGPVDLAAGGLVASTSHLLAWARFQLTGLAADGTVLLSPPSLARMHEPVVRAHDRLEIGLDWFVVRSPGGTTIDHGGLTVGYCSDLVIAPEAGVAVVSLCHATNGGAVNQVVRRWALSTFAGIDEADPTPDDSLAVDVARFAGVYLSPFALLTIRVGDDGTSLRVEPSRRDDVTGWRPPPDPPITLRFFTDDHAVSVDAPAVQRTVRFAPDGSWLLWGSRRSPRIGDVPG